MARQVLGAVLHSLRDRMLAGLAAYLGQLLPLLIRGAYYEASQPTKPPQGFRPLPDFFAHVSTKLRATRQINAEDAMCAVFRMLAHDVDPGQFTKAADAMPGQVRVLWMHSSVHPMPGFRV